MIQLATALLPSAPTAPSSPGAVLSTTSDFALALAQLSAPASVAAPCVQAKPDAGLLTPVANAAVPLPERQALAAPGTILPGDAPLKRSVMPQIDAAAAVAPEQSPPVAISARTPLPHTTPLMPQPAAKPVDVVPATTVAPLNVAGPQVSPATTPAPVVAEATGSPEKQAAAARPAPKRQVTPLAPDVVLATTPPPTADTFPAVEPTATTRDAVETSEPDPIVAVPQPTVPPVPPLPLAAEPVWVEPQPAPVTRAASATSQPLIADAAPPAPSVPQAGTTVPTTPEPVTTPFASTPAVEPQPHARPAQPGTAPGLLPPITQANPYVTASQPNGPVAAAPVVLPPAPELLRAAMPAPAEAPKHPDAPIRPATMVSTPGPVTSPPVEVPGAAIPPATSAPAIFSPSAASPAQPAAAPLASTPQPIAPAQIAIPLAEAPIVAAADRVARTLMPAAAPAPAVDQPIRANFEPRPASAPVTPLRAASAPQPMRAPEQPAAAAFAAQLFAAASVSTADDASDPLAELTAAFPLAGLTGAAPAPEQVAAQDVPLDLADDSWMTGMIDRIETLRDAGGAQSETRIRLTPDALGGIDVAITRDETGALQVQLSTDTAQARAVLAEAAPRLADMAETRGLKLGNTGVDSGAGQPSGERRDSHQPTPARPRPASARAETPSQTTDHRIA